MSYYYRTHGAFTEPGPFAAPFAAPTGLADLCDLSRAS